MGACASKQQVRGIYLAQKAESRARARRAVAPAPEPAAGEEDTATDASQTSDLARYTEADAIFKELSATVKEYHPVRLVRKSWLVKQRGSVLPRRQDLPDEAFVSSEELRAVWEASGRGGLDKVLPIITVSFCWDTREHPDPMGKQLDLIIDALEANDKKFGKAFDPATDKSLYVVPEHRGTTDFKGFTELGVFWDWLSLLQGDLAKVEEARATATAEGKRSEEDIEKVAWEAFRTPTEKAAFDHALKETMDLWYAHQGTTVLLLTDHPKTRGSTREAGYDESGWTTYERCSAEQIKKVLRYQALWPAVIDLGGGSQGAAVAAGRRWPVGPDKFDTMISSRSFTNGADREAVKKLFRKMSLAQLGSISELIFAGMPRLESTHIAGLKECLSLCANLRVLGFGNLHMGHVLFIELTELISSGVLPVLQDLGVTGNDIGAEGAAALARALPAVPQLKELKLGSNSIGDKGAAALADTLPKVPEMKVLILHTNKIGDKGAVALATALQSLPNLQDLNLSSNPIGDEGAAAVASALPALQCMQDLRLQKSSIGDKGAVALADTLPKVPQMKVLYLFENEIGDKGAVALAMALQSLPNLQDLDLAINSIGDEGAAAVAHALPALPRLQDLKLNKNGIGDEGAAALADALPKVPEMKVLYLFENEIGTKGAVALATALQSLPNLQNLILGTNSIGDEGAAAVARALPFLGQLQDLKLNQNSIGDEGAAALADALPKVPQMKVLWLWQNKIGDKGAMALATALQSVPNLQELRLRFNNMGADGEAAIRSAWGARGGVLTL